MIDAAAVLGSRFPFDVLAALVGVGEDELIPVLRRLVDAGLLVEDEPDVFSFRHALTREAIAGQLLGRERRRLHEKALNAVCASSAATTTPRSPTTPRAPVAMTRSSPSPARARPASSAWG